MSERPQGLDEAHEKVAVVIVAFNNGDELKKCVYSVPRSAHIRILVVDNSDTALGREMVDGLHASGLVNDVLRPGQNVGFSRGVNAGLRATADDEDILLVNPDAVLDEGCLEILQAASKQDSNVALISPVVYSDTSVRTMTAGEQPTIWRLFLHYSFLSRIFSRVHFLRGRYLFLDKHAKTDRYVTWSAACVWYLPRQTIREYGGLSEEWFLYGEDIEYCRRIVKTKRRILLVAKARAYHGMAVSVSKADRSVSTMWPRNTYSYYVKEFNPGFVRRWLWRVVFSAGLYSRAQVYLLSTSTRERGRRLATLARSVWE